MEGRFANVAQTPVLPGSDDTLKIVDKVYVEEWSYPLCPIAMVNSKERW